jgi:hypothetical protein
MSVLSYGSGVISAWAAHAPRDGFGASRECAVDTCGERAIAESACDYGRLRIGMSALFPH